MKILFVFSCDFNAQPLGIMTLAAVLKKHGHCCEFLDLKFESNIINKIKKIKPDIIAYSVVSFNWNFYKTINLKIKKKYSCFSIFGGPHCSTYPDFIYEEGVDAICIGEGEEALLELTDKLQNNQNITDIKNLWIKKDGIVYKNEIRPLIDNLDLLPFPDQELIRKYQFYKNSGTYYFITSRGCKYNCPYCINHFYKKLYFNKGKYIRSRSVESAISELLILKNKYKAKLIVFVDDIFILDEEWLLKFAVQYKEKINLPFESYIRVELTNSKILSALKEMGCIAVYLGIETGNEVFRNKILGRSMTNEQIINTSILVQQFGIKTMALNMMGLPDETLDNAIETLLLNATCKITYPLCFIFQPFPNLELTSYAIEKGYFDGNINSYHRSFNNGKSLIDSPDRKRIERLHLLFLIGVKMPWLVPVIKRLIKLPLDAVYRFIYFISKSYVLIFILKKPFLKQYLLFNIKFGFYKTMPFLIKK